MNAISFECNNLTDATSPYLLQHAENPVHWQQWGPEVLDHAKSVNKPILLSVGYAACHWCHVMAHESFEDPDTARLMNQLYVNIKVDREERPDIDQIYMAALHAMGEQGGWPLTMILTPDAVPFWGGTYFPPAPAHGRPSFAQVLIRISEVFHREPDAVSKNATALKSHLDKINQTPVPEDQPIQRTIDDFVERSMQIYDPENGGIKGIQKFPNAPIMEIWARNAKGNANTPTGSAFVQTIRNICNGGIYDHLRGGIARYTVDHRWLVPHFEKMLYDNAHFIRHLNLAYKLTGETLFRNRIEETVNWLEAEMVEPNGGFYSSLDADSEGVEGKFYTWTATEIADILGNNFEIFADHYDVTPEGNWENVSILNRLKRPEIDFDIESNLSESRNKLLSVRNTRIRPGLDDKILTDWNGYMIRALAEVARDQNRVDWLGLAASAFRFISESTPEQGQLAHASRKGVSGGLANAADYGAMINAALELYQSTSNTNYLKNAKHWFQILSEKFSDGNGGYYLTSSDVEDLISRPRCDQDEANPAGSAQILEALVRYANLANDHQAYDEAGKLAANLYASSKSSPYGMAGFINGLDSLLNHAHAIVTGPEKGTRDDLTEVLKQTPIVAMTYLQSENPEHFANLTASDRKQKDPSTYAIVCTQFSCSAPMSDKNTLSDYLGHISKN